MHLQGCLTSRASAAGTFVTLVASATIVTKVLRRLQALVR